MLHLLSGSVCSERDRSLILGYFVTSETCSPPTSPSRSISTSAFDLGVDLGEGRGDVGVEVAGERDFVPDFGFVVVDPGSGT